MKKYKGIIFDLDGVICHTDKYHYLAWKKLADELEIDFDEEFNNRFRGVSREACLNMLLESADITATKEEKTQLCDRKNGYYKELLKEMSKKDLSEEVKSTLDKLKAEGYKMAIGSSSKNVSIILKRLGLEDFFDKISDGNNISKSKPDPEVFVVAAEMLNLSAKDCLVVEDAEAGIEAAEAGGFDSAGLGEASKYSKTTYKLNNFKEILDIV
ncbi:MAG: beta-phosphoglucomutase [Eubacterium ventriosum]|uniref:beta-phosphoglucomutase n=1 Tax=Eubacterium ventriosum TaxID=39496 RepID=UPI001D5F5ADD|nr:beta-phosphoglucomutase [Eubacterium ventriosum]MBD9056508.1 beta-phosphoglucomutase [Eubacterium ventriosum]